MLAEEDLDICTPRVLCGRDLDLGKSVQLPSHYSRLPTTHCPSLSVANVVIHVAIQPQRRPSLFYIECQTFKKGGIFLEEVFLTVGRGNFYSVVCEF